MNNGDNIVFMNLTNQATVDEYQRNKTSMELFGNLTVIGRRDEINENEHRLKHFQMKLSEFLNEKVLNLRTSIVQNIVFCCVVTRYTKASFHTTTADIDKVLNGDESLISSLKQLINEGVTK